MIIGKLYSEERFENKISFYFLKKIKAALDHAKIGIRQNFDLFNRSHSLCFIDQSTIPQR